MRHATHKQNKPACTKVHVTQKPTWDGPGPTRGKPMKCRPYGPTTALSFRRHHLSTTVKRCPCSSILRGCSVEGARTSQPRCRCTMDGIERSCGFLVRRQRRHQISEPANSSCHILAIDVKTGTARFRTIQHHSLLQLTIMRMLNT